MRKTSSENIVWLADKITGHTQYFWLTDFEIKSQKGRQEFCIGLSIEILSVSQPAVMEEEVVISCNQKKSIRDVVMVVRV